MSLIASRSACLGSSVVAVSGGGFTSIDLQLYLPILGADRKGLDGREGGKGLWATGSQIEQRSVSGALNGTGRRIELALGQGAGVVRAPILDRQELAGAVEDADLDSVDLDELHGSVGELICGAYGVVCHRIPTLEVGF